MSRQREPWGPGGGGRRGRPRGPVWARPEPARRRPRYTREEIAAAAVAIADAEGFEAVSMRRLAGELRAGTMTLYHYVHDKEELLALMDDAIMGELLIPDDELPADWREALDAIARRSRAAQRRHPWAAESLRGAGIGPNGMKHIDQSLAAVAGLAVDPQVQLEIVMMVDDYIEGFSVHAREAHAEEIRPDDLGYTESLVATGRYPRLAELADERGLRGVWERFMVVMTDEERFDRGLARLLDGIELDLRRRGALS